MPLIDVAADAGADAVKFQTYTAEGLYSRRTPDMRYLKDQGLVGDRESVWELIKRVEIPWEWHADLARHAAQAGITFLSTPFEEAAVDVLEEVGVPAYKLASYEVNHLPLIAHAARTGKPLLISTGMASLGDIEHALDAAARSGRARPAAHALRGQLSAPVRGPQPARHHHSAERVRHPDRVVGSHARTHRRRGRGDARRVRGREALHTEPRPAGPGPSRSRSSRTSSSR